MLGANPDVQTVQRRILFVYNMAAHVRLIACLNHY